MLSRRAVTKINGQSIYTQSTSTTLPLGMWMRVADGFGAAAPACIVTMTAIAAEHLPKVIRRQVYYGSESS